MNKYYIMAPEKGYIGNYCIWWKPDRRGYTPHIEEAGQYTSGEVRDILSNKYTDLRAFPVEYVDSLSRRVIDPHDMKDDPYMKSTPSDGYGYGFQWSDTGEYEPETFTSLADAIEHFEGSGADYDHLNIVELDGYGKTVRTYNPETQRLS